MSRIRIHRSKISAPRRAPVGLFSPQRVLALCVAATMAVDAYVHLHDAAFYDLVGTRLLSQGTLFRAEAAVAVATAVVLLIWPRPVTWAASLLVAGSAFVAVLLSTYVNVGALGPLPNMFEPTWALPGKLASAWAEAIGTLLAWNGLFLSVDHLWRGRSAPTLWEADLRADGPDAHEPPVNAAGPSTMEQRRSPHAVTPGSGGLCLPSRVSDPEREHDLRNPPEQGHEADPEQDQVGALPERVHAVGA